LLFAGDLRVLHFSLHDALPIYRQGVLCFKHACELLKLSKDCELTGAVVAPETAMSGPATPRETPRAQAVAAKGPDRPSDTQQIRSEEHTSELQSRENLVCRLLL